MPRPDAPTHGRKKLITPTMPAIVAMIFLIENEVLFIDCGAGVGLTGDMIGCGSGGVGGIGGVGGVGCVRGCCTG